MEKKLNIQIKINQNDVENNIEKNLNPNTINGNNEKINNNDIIVKFSSIKQNRNII
jgi:hypothetical protein